MPKRRHAKHFIGFLQASFECPWSPQRKQRSFLKTFRGWNMGFEGGGERIPQVLWAVYSDFFAVASEIS